LGTSTSKEGKDYFKNLHKHKKDFLWMDELDGDAIELAFSKKKIEARKNWLRQHEVGFAAYLWLKKENAYRMKLLSFKGILVYLNFAAWYSP
jgi:hypothetical protein